jgi:hypothetical protein
MSEPAIEWYIIAIALSLVFGFSAIGIYLPGHCIRRIIPIILGFAVRSSA